MKTPMQPPRGSSGATDPDYAAAQAAIERGADKAKVIARYESGSSQFDDLIPSAASADQSRPTTLQENVVGMTRQAMNRIMFGKYPQAVGKVAEMFGGDAEAEAKKLGQYMAQYQAMAPKKAAVGRTIGEVVPYALGVGGIAKSTLGAIPAASRGMGVAAQGYQRLLQTPLRRVLPSSGMAAGEIAAIEGTRGAMEAEPGESRVAAALSRVPMALPFGKAGEVVGTYMAGRAGPTLARQSAKAEAAMQKAGEQINRYREEATVEVTPALSQLYARSKDLREAVNATAESLGLPATDPEVLATAYSQLTAEASPVFRKKILTPFLDAIDQASTVPLSAGIKAYAKAASIKTGAEAGMKTGQYLRTGAGNPLEVGPDVMVGRQLRSFVSPEQRQAAAQALIASIGESRAPLLQQGVARSLLTQGRGIGKIAEAVEQLGGTPSLQQALLQRTGRGLGASRTGLQQATGSVLNRLFLGGQ